MASHTAADLVAAAGALAQAARDVGLDPASMSQSARGSRHIVRAA
jgi:hypothetical protein